MSRFVPISLRLKSVHYSTQSVGQFKFFKITLPATSLKKLHSWLTHGIGTVIFYCPLNPLFHEWSINWWPWVLLLTSCHKHEWCRFLNRSSWNSVVWVSDREVRIRIKLTSLSFFLWLLFYVTRLQNASSFFCLRSFNLMTENFCNLDRKVRHRHQKELRTSQNWLRIDLLRKVWKHTIGHLAITVGNRE